MPFRFIFFTWILITPIHIISIALSYCLLSWLDTGVGHFARYFDFEILGTIGGLSLLFSIPGLLGLMGLVWVAKEFLYYPADRFAFICFGSAFITIICYMVIEITLSINMELKGYFPFILASICSVLIALFLTRKYYFSYLNHRTAA